MGIFDFIKDILYKKSGTLLAKKEIEGEFQPYMIQRWLSMHSRTNARILNSTSNKIYKCLDEKSQWYKLFLSVVPKSKFKRFTYIKKTSPKEYNHKNGLDNAIKLIAQTHEMSEREVRQYIEDNKIDISNIEKLLKEG